MLFSHPTIIAGNILEESTTLTVLLRIPSFTSTFSVKISDKMTRQRLLHGDISEVAGDPESRLTEQ